MTTGVDRSTVGKRKNVDGTSELEPEHRHQLGLVRLDSYLHGAVDTHVALLSPIDSMCYISLWMLGGHGLRNAGSEALARREKKKEN